MGRSSSSRAGGGVPPATNMKRLGHRQPRSHARDRVPPSVPRLDGPLPLADGGKLDLQRPALAGAAAARVPSPSPSCSCRDKELD